MGVSGPIFAVPDLKWRRAVQSNSHPLLSFFRSLLDLSGIRQCSGCGLRALTCVAIGFVALACAPVAMAQISGFPTECDPPVVDINVDGDLGAINSIVPSQISCNFNLVGPDNYGEVTYAYGCVRGNCIPIFNQGTVMQYVGGPDDPAAVARDYAYREWSGLLEDYYLPRWEMFVEDLDARLQGKPGREINYFEFERRWTEERKDYPVDPRGDPVGAAAAALASLAPR